MLDAQSGIFADQSTIHHYLEYSLSDTDLSAVITAVKKILEQDRGEVECVIAFGPDLSQKLFKEGDRPAFNGLAAIQGKNNFVMPSTQRDIFIWLHGATIDRVYEQVMQVDSVLAKVAKLGLDLRGFRYLDARDLTGFIDGTENPQGEAMLDAALIPDGQSGAGGSIVLSQKWVHNLQAFHQLSQSEQERVIGRTKPDSIELSGDAMPEDSHVSRADAKVGGEAMKIYRRSAPHGLAAEKGLYFLAFACAQKRIQIQLDRMFGVSGDGLYDRLIEYSTPVTGSYWYAPPQQVLEKL